ncbi:SMP-30/gluconolactonase/LRE family protein [Streptomyces sp. NPDC088747]|uniref:SMP-30/gluconolactonase/LRE family protein n=1 Tax=Streptomyces sp. NPDC088747 TaxID=3365886 RepID=UPI0038064788
MRIPVRLLATLATIGTLALTGCGTESGDPGSEPAHLGADGTIRAQQVMQLTKVHVESGMTLLEGPTFAKDGSLFVVDVTAPAGAPKLLRVNLAKKTSRAVHTDGHGAYTSAQFSPDDGRLYLTDYAQGRVVSLAPDGSDPRTFFSGDVEGAQMNPDDIAFDEEGNLYISDSRGLSENKAHGRIVRIDRTGRKVTVLAEGLASPNGVSFDDDFSGLWISELTQNRISYLGLDSSGAVVSQHTAIRVDGGIAETDSIAVDRSGNLYQALHGRPAMGVFDKYGQRLSTVEIPGSTKGLTSATNVAITPGGRTAYMTVSGPAGGYLYSFDALAEGTRQSNGG